MEVDTGGDLFSWCWIQTLSESLSCTELSPTTHFLLVPTQNLGSTNKKKDHPPLCPCGNLSLVQLVCHHTAG